MSIISDLQPFGTGPESGRQAIHLPVGSGRVTPLFNIVFMFPLLLLMTGCSAYMAMQQPERKNLSVLEPGTPRITVITAMGVPETTHIEQGERTDVFQFKEGYAREIKLLRAAFHITADAFTIGLWEPFGILFEKWATSRDIRIRVRYDAQDRVKVFDVLSGGKTVLVSAPTDTLPAFTEVNLSPVVTSVLMPQMIPSHPKRLAVILPNQGPTASFVSSGLDLTLAYLRTFHPAMTIVEREGIEPVTRELLLQHTGKVQEDTITPVGGWKGADSLLIVKIEQISADRSQTILRQGGEVAHSVEIRLTQVETAVILFRQTVLARVRIPPPTSTRIWAEQLIEDAKRETLRVAYTHSLAALAAAFGDNPLGLVPDMSSRNGGIRLLGLLHGGPGQQAGLQEGDRILETNGTPYKSVTQRITLPAKLLVERKNKRKEVLVASQRIEK